MHLFHFAHEAQKLLTGQFQRDFSAALVDAIVIVVSPLNSLINYQISKLRMSSIRASVLNVKVKGLRRDRDDGCKWLMRKTV